jgi:hypothetical protein
MQAVLKPASARPKAARRPAPPAPTTMASYSWSMTGYLLEMKPDASFALRFPVPNMRCAGRVEEKARVVGRKLLASCCDKRQPLVCRNSPNNAESNPKGSRRLQKRCLDVRTTCQSHVGCGTRLGAADAGYNSCPAQTCGM